MTTDKKQNISAEAHAKWSTVLQRDRSMLKRVGIGSGLSGLALYQYLNYVVSGTESSLDSFFCCVEDAVELVNDGSAYHPLWLADLTELTYLLKITEKTLQEGFDIQTLQSNLEECLFQTGIDMLSRGELDPFTGAFYPAYYFRHMKARPELLKPFVEYIVNNTIETKEGLFFDSCFQQDEKCLSLTHGLAYYLLFLCGLDDMHLPSETNRSLVRGFVSYLMAHRFNGYEKGCFFPDYTGKSNRTRLCLCYGDLGILFALLKAAYWLRDKQLLTQVRSMLNQTYTRRTKEETKILQNNLLYGDAGLLLFYRSIAKYVPSHELDETIKFWESSVIKKINEIEWDCYYSDKYKQKEGTYPLQFSEGITGILACLHTGSIQKNEIILFPFYLM